ncbi:MAG: MBOAT family protein [Acidobacteria bacterium]|nr:MBOAT family protein [Acidobacteriota bacterium]
MLFNSWVFIVFFIVVYLLYLRFERNSQNWLLLFSSYIFYSFWDWRFLSLLLISTLVDYYCGINISTSATRYRKRILLVTSLSVNLGLLAVFKYYDFFISSFIDVAAKIGFHPSIHTMGLILPMGISFYTFQTLSYTIDIYRGKLEPCKNLRDFALFVTFFPQLVAGPIERATHLIAQIVSPRYLNTPQIRKGAWLLLQGYFFKVVVADNAAVIVDRVFGAEDISGTSALIGIYGFALQIYGDFAGYSKIARGLANLMGFDLRLNFKQPYLATNPSEFWSRWHISLSSWLRDYLYISLGGNRRGKRRTYINLMTTMLLGGLWHGAHWKFVLWGLYHGLVLVIFRFLADFRAFNRISSGWLKPFRIFLFFQIVCFGWLIFRCESLEQIWTFPVAIWSGLAFTPVDKIDIQAIIFLAVPVIILDLIEEYASSLKRLVSVSSGTHEIWIKFRYVLYAVPVVYILAMIFLCGVRGGTEFIYFQF